MSWTTPTELRAQVQMLWDKGLLLGVGGDVGPETSAALFPKRLRLRGPTSSDLSARFDDVRLWMANLRDSSPRLRIVLRQVRHSAIGSNAVPDEVWIDTREDALALIGKQLDARRFEALVQATATQHAQLLPWLHQHPLQALALADEWARLLAIVTWCQSHPRPGIYLRQIDIAGVDSKFIEAHLRVLAGLLELALPPEQVDASASGQSQFCRRYGFRDKPLRIRFRLLDPKLSLLPGAGEQDLAVTAAAFAQLDLPVSRVFITENEINFLAFPAVAGAMVVFGAGYGFEVLEGTAWLQTRQVYYWGDIDTHGFAILDQLRARLPQAQSLLMDSATLMAHELHWDQEPKPELRDLNRLTHEELALFDALRDNRLGMHLRLEQERVGLRWVKSALADLPSVGNVPPTATYE